MWVPIILALIQALVPFFEKLLLMWLEKRMREEAAKLGPMSFGSDRDAQRFLLRKVRDSLWFWEWKRKRFLDTLLAQV